MFFSWTWRKIRSGCIFERKKQQQQNQKPVDITCGSFSNALTTAKFSSWSLARKLSFTESLSSIWYGTGKQTIRSNKNRKIQKHVATHKLKDKNNFRLWERLCLLNIQRSVLDTQHCFLFIPMTCWFPMLKLNSVIQSASDVNEFFFRACEDSGEGFDKLSPTCAFLFSL